MISLRHWESLLIADNISTSDVSESVCERGPVVNVIEAKRGARNENTAEF